ncbi:sensor histidine kinase [Yoonia sediminilitoris]|uniref:histidine kinase n=1 Tax=Yoonia sediminilitoris TaxID=1286148 RepID=A0A2T6KS60_9RHOB|nr:ATP-binding protein [Yoonia sediminilitoris]PUB19406.1 two-component system phosphate regulon sensor histidine kinase PhoR [Yoonia sediminilitoris]RCW99574.1 two-component system phosphate regulon sensor histidine kinase PhoR [Yoonia sediminilitoris]
MTSLVHALAAPTLVVGPDERLVAMNDPFAALVGAGQLGKHYITTLRQPAVADAIASVLAGGPPVQTRYFLRDGSKDTVYDVKVAPAGDCVVLSFEDQSAAEDAGQMRRDFVANVSHELRTPLTALLGFIETLTGAARDDPAARDRFLQIMAHEANRMTRLVDDLLSLSRVESDARVRPLEPVDLGGVLASVIKGLEPQASAAGVTVSLSVPDATQTIPGDAGQLAQVFANLIENGLKYGARGGVLSVVLDAAQMQTKLRANGVRICVSDSGEGIAEHHLARLTERFYRVDNHRSRAVGGTGLGLAIVKHIVNRHRGKLTIESTLGQGTQVSVFLPSH